MDDESFRIAELLLQGYTCGHVLAKLALEAQGHDNPDLVRAMSGLALGMGRGLNCGSLSGGCCILGLYGGRANDGEQVHPRFDLMIEQFSAWFVDAMGEKYGGVNCQEIINFDPKLMQQRCPGLILESWRKIKEILAEHKVDVAGPAPAVWDEG
jgi:hypothetical protein